MRSSAAAAPSVNPGPTLRILPAPTIADPVLVTQNPNGLKFKFDQPGIYSAAVAAYDSSGLGAITRIDGFEVQPPVKSGLCLTIDSEPIEIQDPWTRRGQTLGFSGNCVTRLTTKTGDVLLYASTTPIDIDGVPVTPKPGQAIVIEHPNAHAEVYVAPNCKISTATLAGGTIPGSCRPPSHAAAGTLYLALGTGNDQSPPGITDLPKFDPVEADKYLGARAPGGLQPVGKLVYYGSGPHKGQLKSSVDQCGLYPNSQPWSASPKGAQYDGFNVSTIPCVTFTATGGQSRIAFWDSLPPGFDNGGKSKPATSQVVLQGADRPALSFLTANQYANVARARARAGSRGALRVLDGPLESPRAHIADIGLPGFPGIPSCPPSTNGKSGLSIPKDTDLGPISLPAGAQFCYIPKTGDFVGNVTVNVPGPLPLNGVEVGFEIGHGRLINAGGEISANIPVGPLFINDFKFDVQTEPTVVGGAIEASILEVLDVEAGVIVKPDVPSVDFEGTVAIFGIQFGNFAIDWTKNTVGMHVTVAKDFGPASINITVQGAMMFSPQFAFYLEGDGNACLFICLGVKGLISSEGFAACGSINLLFVTLSAGFAVIWSGPQSGFHLFTGCDLSPYIPAGLQNVPGTAPDLAARDPGLQPTLSPGQSEPIVLHRKGACTPKLQTHCTHTVLAIQVHSLLSSEVPGQTPVVTLSGPPGSDPRAVGTPSEPGYYGFDASASQTGGAQGGQTFEGTALVDQNPVPTVDTNTMSSAYCPTSSVSNASTLPPGCARVTTTTLFVADPGKGKWTLTVDAGSPPVVDVARALTQPPLNKKQLGGTVHTATLQAAGPGFVVRVGAQKYSSSRLSDNHLLLAPSVEIPPFTRTALVALRHPSAGLLDVPPIDQSRLRATLLKVPADFQGTVAVIDHGPTVDQVLANGITSKSIPRGGLPIVFEPTPDFGGAHQIEAFLSNSAGMPVKTIMLSSFTSPPLRTPDAPRIVKIARIGTTVEVYFHPGNAPISNGIGLALATAGGQQFEQTINGSDLHPVGPLEGIGAAKQASEYMVSIADVDPTEKINLGHRRLQRRPAGPDGTELDPAARHSPNGGAGAGVRDRDP